MLATIVFLVSVMSIDAYPLYPPGVGNGYNPTTEYVQLYDNDNDIVHPRYGSHPPSVILPDYIDRTSYGSHAYDYRINNEGHANVMLRQENDGFKYNIDQHHPYGGSSRVYYTLEARH